MLLCVLPCLVKAVGGHSFKCAHQKAPMIQGVGSRIRNKGFPDVYYTLRSMAVAILIYHFLG